MKKFIPLLLFPILFACGGKSNENQIKNQDVAFDTYKEAFILRLWEMYPSWASGSGFHQYDSVLTIPDEASRKQELAFVRNELKGLVDFQLNELSANNQIDFHLIENQLKSTEWEQKTLKSYQWDPSRYNVCGSFAEMINNNYDTLDTRLRNVSKRLLLLPAYYEAAKNNIKNPTIEHTQLAIDQNSGGTSVFTSDLPSAIQKSGLSIAEKDTLTIRSNRAVVAINKYATWLKELKNDQPRSFRLGKELYAEKFKYDIQAEQSATEIYQRALKHKKELHEKMVAISRKIWTKHMGTVPQPTNEYALVKDLINKLSENHAKPKEFQAEIEAQIPELEKFVNAKKLLYLDPKKPLVVRREPDYMAGVAGASISAPGPYDKNGNTYYNVGSLTGWSAEESESYLREYNDYVLQILNIHEAIPGHYSQLVYSNQSPSIIKAILGNGAMIEGWAVYTELMMLENGYGAQSGSATATPEMWLMYYKWNLRTTCNTILDYSVHNLNMSKEVALSLLVNEAYQQQAEAEGKWKRATLTQVQLCSYFTGYSEIVDLRKILMDKEKKNFKLKAFHEQFLSYGSAPVKYIKRLMVN